VLRPLCLCVRLPITRIFSANAAATIFARPSQEMARLTGRYSILRRRIGLVEWIKRLRSLCSTSSLVWLDLEFQSPHPHADMSTISVPWSEPVDCFNCTSLLSYLPDCFLSVIYDTIALETGIGLGRPLPRHLSLDKRLIVLFFLFIWLCIWGRHGWSLIWFGFGFLADGRA
jgi:hypothetical protein